MWLLQGKNTGHGTVVISLTAVKLICFCVHKLCFHLVRQ